MAVVEPVSLNGDRSYRLPRRSETFDPDSADRRARRREISRQDESRKAPVGYHVVRYSDPAAHHDGCQSENRSQTATGS